VAKTFDKITPARFAGLMKTEGRTNDGPGFYLQVSRIKTASGEPGNLTASNLFKFTLGGKRREMGLGKVIRYEDLVKGRERAAAARDLVYDRVDPIEQRRKDRATKLAETPTLMTFEDAFKGFLRDKRREWSNAVHAAQWETTMRDYALPVLGKISVAAIDTQLVLRCIKPIWESRTETAKRVRGRIEAVLSWCTAHKLRSGPNPAEWKNHLSNILAKPSKLVKVKSHPAMDYDDVPGFVAKLVELDTQAARAIRLLILTATRLNELRFARWDEVDLDGRMWVIPAERTKRDREHPLAEAPDRLALSLPRRVHTTQADGRPEPARAPARGGWEGADPARLSRQLLLVDGGAHQLPDSGARGCARACGRARQERRG